MMDNKTARKEVKLLKALEGVSYSEFADMVGISKNSIYCWLNQQFELGVDRLKVVEEVIADWKGE